MNIYIEFGMYGFAIMFILTFIISWIRNREISADLRIIPNSAFGLVTGGVGRYIYDKVVEEIFPVNETVGIILICCFGLGILFTLISILFRRTSQ